MREVKPGIFMLTVEESTRLLESIDTTWASGGHVPPQSGPPEWFLAAEAEALDEAQDA